MLATWGSKAEAGQAQTAANVPKPFFSTTIGRAFVSGIKEGVKGWAKEDKYDKNDFLNDFSTEFAKDLIFPNDFKIMPNSPASFGKVAKAFLQNELVSFGKNAAGQGLKYMEGKETDNFWKVFGDASDDPFKLLMAGLQGRTDYQRLFAFQMAP